MKLVDYREDLAEVPDAHLDDAITDCFYRWLSDCSISPYPAQEDAFFTIAAGDHLILSTPTGSGKSLVAIYAHWWSLTHQQRSFYTAPIKALVNEKFFALCEVFGSADVGLMTGDASVNVDAPIICATAEILANKALREGSDCPVDLVVMDEFHFITDRDRGWAWHVPLIELTQTQFLLLSATLGDTQMWKTGLEERTGRPVTEVTNNTRPIPLTFRYSQSPLNETLIQLIEDGLGSVYVVFFSQKSALDYARQLKAIALIETERRRQIADALKDVRFTTRFGIQLRELLLRGIGVHHGGMLPKYRRLVERLAQQGLLAVICGTDTLGVGINVPIHTVLFSGLAKFDGHKERILRVREFQQIAGRAGRAGFDSEGLVVVQATDKEIEALRATRRGVKPKKKSPPRPGERKKVSWNQKTFEKLTSSAPENLSPTLPLTPGMILHVVDRPGSLYEHLRHLITTSYCTRAQQRKVALQAFSQFRELEETGIVIRQDSPFPDGRWVQIDGDLPSDIALNQPLAAFALAYISLLDPEDPDFPWSVLSVVESIIEDPGVVLYAQQKHLRDAAAAELRTDGVSYQEVMAELDDITWPQPLAEELTAALSIYQTEHPWARQWDLHPKSIVREMAEDGLTFGDFISRYSIARAEGTVLHYLSECYRTLSHLLSEHMMSPALKEILHWLRVLIEQVDNSLLAEWEALSTGRTLSETEERYSEARPLRLTESKHIFTRMVRTLMFKHVDLLALDKTEQLSSLDERICRSYPDWYEASEPYWDEYDAILTDQDARNRRYCAISEDSSAPHVWNVQQTICDPEGDHSWVITAVVNLDDSDEAGEVRFDSMNLRDLTESQ